MSHTRHCPLAVPALSAALIVLAMAALGCSRKAEAPQPATPGAQQPAGQAATSGRPADFSGKWLCMYQGKDRIPGAVTQKGNQVTGYCVYTDGNRATFTGTVSGNTLSGTLDVRHQNRQWPIKATLNGDSMTGTWGGSNPWSATRQ